MDNFDEGGKYAGELINLWCPECGAKLMGNAIGDQWCSVVDCVYISFVSDSENPSIDHLDKTSES